MAKLDEQLRPSTECLIACDITGSTTKLRYQDSEHTIALLHDAKVDQLPGRIVSSQTKHLYLARGQHHQSCVSSYQQREGALKKMHKEELV